MEKIKNYTLNIDSGYELKVGDKYLAKRNGPWRILTVKEISDKHYIVPEEVGYSYDTWECYKILEGEDYDKLEEIWLELEIDYEKYLKDWWSTPLLVNR